MRPLRRTVCCLLAAYLCLGAALAELPWPRDLSPSQEKLRAWTDRVNANLTAMGSPPVNTLLECYPALATLGVTREDNADTLESVELTVTMSGGELDRLDLRCSDFSRFPALVAACVAAASPEGTDPKALLSDPKAYVNRVNRAPKDSFADAVIESKGDAPRVYYAYTPDEYHDGVDWLRMTMIFPREGTDGAIATTPVPDTADEHMPLSNEDGDADWVGYFPVDDATHFEYFVTPTPEPDSAVYYH